MNMLFCWMCFLWTGTPDAGEVTFPLDDYLALVGAAETQRAARQRALEDRVPDIAELTTQTVRIRLDQELADVETEAELIFEGERLLPVSFPLTGYAETIRFEGDGDTMVASKDGRIQVAVSQAGAFRLFARGRLKPEITETGLVLAVAPIHAPVARLEVDLPEDLHWFGTGVTLVAERQVDGRRLLTFAPAKGTTLRLEVSRKKIIYREVLARVELVTLVRVLDRAIMRHDIFFYEVERGTLDVFRVSLPDGLVIDEVATDEGVTAPRFRDGQLIVTRKTRLQGPGYLVLTSAHSVTDRLALPVLVPDFPVQARYLVTATAIPAEVAPEPADLWFRMDMEDLPPLIRDSAKRLDLSAVWQAGRTGDGVIALKRFPSIRTRELLAGSRRTTTVWTREGVLVTKDRIALTKHGGVFEFQPPPGARLWSAMVNENAVRPIQRNGRFYIPLTTRGPALVDTVTVQELALPVGKGRVTIPLAKTDLNVMLHQWEVMLPEGRRYRIRESGLQPVSALANLDTSFHMEAARIDLFWEKVPAGKPVIAALVTVEDGSPLPGALATLSKSGFSRDQVSDADGEVLFLEPGEGVYQMRVSFDGFNTWVRPNILLRGNDQQILRVVLAPSTMQEELLVTAESSLADLSRSNRAVSTAKAFAQLDKHFGGGIKPLPINIPKEGKVLFLRGVLPPDHVDLVLMIR